MASGSLVSSGLRERIRGLASPVAVAFGRAGLTPNHLTLIGFGIAIAAAVAGANQAWLAAGLLVLFGGAFDLLDGALARATGRVSRLGAFMDSVFDRWGEGVVYVGIAWGCVAADVADGAIFATAALASAVMVSYARAKSDGLGFTSGTGMASVGLAPREVRIVILAAGLIGSGLYAGGSFNLNFGPMAVFAEISELAVLALALGLITILATITTIQRILHVVSQSEGDPES